MSSSLTNCAHGWERGCFLQEGMGARSSTSSLVSSESSESGWMTRVLIYLVPVLLASYIDSHGTASLTGS